VSCAENDQFRGRVYVAENDSFAHAAGDVVLTRVSEVPRARVRATDSVYRLGGQELLASLSAFMELDLAGLVPGGHIAISRSLRLLMAMYESTTSGRERVTLHRGDE
jgi:diguanylate cyclase (GGDEF)-like protein